MKGIILSAGKGSRFGGKVKGLLEIDGKPIVKHQIDAMRDAGISDIYVVTGYGAEQFPDFGVNYIYNYKYDTLENSYSLYLALREINDDSVVVVDGDVMHDYRSYQHLTPECVYYIDTGKPRAKGDVGIEFFVDDVALAIGKEETYGVGNGIVTFSKEFVKYFTGFLGVTDFSTWWIVYANQQRAHLFKYKIARHKWCEVDTLEDYDKAKLMFDNPELELNNNDYTFDELDSMYRALPYEGLHVYYRNHEKDVIAYANSNVVTGRLNGRIIGMVRSTSDGAYYTALYDGMVRPDYQNRKIGEAMYTRLIYQAKQQNPLKIYFFGTVGPSFDHFFTKLGFTRAKSTVWEMRHDW